MLPQHNRAFSAPNAPNLRQQLDALRARYGLTPLSEPTGHAHWPGCPRHCRVDELPAAAFRALLTCAFIAYEAAVRTGDVDALRRWRDVHDDDAPSGERS